MSVTVNSSSGGSIKAELIWTNPNPTGNMNQNTKVSYDLTKYTGVIVYGQANVADYHTNFVYVPKGRAQMDGMLGMAKTYGRRFVGRLVWCDDTGVTFGQGANGDDGNEHKNYAVPVKIWAVKIKGIEV